MRLQEILIETLEGYVAQGVNGYTYLTSNEDKTRFVVVAISEEQRINSFLNIAAHLEQDYVVIYHDANNKILLDALIQNGVPREKIILAYAGETLATAD